MQRTTGSPPRPSTASWLKSIIWQASPADPCTSWGTRWVTQRKIGSLSVQSTASWLKSITCQAPPANQSRVWGTHCVTQRKTGSPPAQSSASWQIKSITWQTPPADQTKYKWQWTTTDLIQCHPPWPGICPSYVLTTNFTPQHQRNRLLKAFN